MAGFPFTYVVTPTEVQVRLGGWVVRRITLTDIERAEVRRFDASLIWNEHWTNLTIIGRRTPFVVLRRRSGFARNFIINPSNPDAFLADLRREAPQLVEPDGDR